MNFFRRIFGSLKSSPQEQIVGYSISELEKLFLLPIPATSLPIYPPTSLLKNVGIDAYYSSFLIAIDEIPEFNTLIASTFRTESERTFNGLTVFQCKNMLTESRLIYFISLREFQSATIRLVTNSTELLILLSQKKFSAPPPWIAFPGYEPAWWGGNMEGAQGYYDNIYFSLFFTNLNNNEKQAYYERFNASQKWIDRLELMYNDD
ncbi:hypothetical protein [Pseudomonas sp. IT-347P]|uniref:hypothetical protein n=1 Tax=Pseudomonas sp. IT-347P TaxID=3026458 RepID=UPI0039E07926